jgi:hypothetical protein
MQLGQKRVLGVILSALGMPGCLGGGGVTTGAVSDGDSASGGSSSSTGGGNSGGGNSGNSADSITEGGPTDEGPNDGGECSLDTHNEVFCVAPDGASGPITLGHADTGDASTGGTGTGGDGATGGSESGSSASGSSDSGSSTSGGALQCVGPTELDAYCADGNLMGVSAPVIEGDQCCYTLECEVEACGSGRPFMIDARARVAPLRSGAQWCVTLEPALAHLGATDRALLAEAWSLDAQAEHASVASFSRFAMELLSVGAPPELVAGAHRAALEEIEHAQICFALASAYAGAPRGPGALAVDGAMQRSGDLAAILRATVEEGCVGETLAAVEADAAASAASDPVVRTALSRIAADEARHAALAWQTVAWALQHGGAAARHAVREGLLQAERGLDQRLAAMPNDGGDGRLAWSQRRALITSTWRDMLEPLAQQLTDAARAA